MARHSSDDRQRGGRRAGSGRAASGWIDVRGPSRPKTRSPLIGTVALFAVVLLGTAGLMLLRANDPMACEQSIPLRIAAAPAIAPAIQEITERDIQPGCVVARVEPRTAADTARSIAAADADTPALWIPDSAMWPERATDMAASFGSAGVTEIPAVAERDPLVMSPLVVVTSRAAGTAMGWPGGSVGWQDLIAGTAPGMATTIGDPLATTEGLATLTAVGGLLGSRDGAPRPELVGAMLQVGRDAAPSISSAYGRLAGSPQPLAFTATEQSVVANNRSGSGADAVAVYPREGTIALEYPLVRVVSQTEAPGVAEAAGRIEQLLRSPESAAVLLAAGFRGVDGAMDPSIDDSLGVVATPPQLMPPPSADQATDVLRTWSAVTLDSRMLVVIDVSGSMDASAGNGRSRIELARDASLTALGLFPDSTSIGLWAFSIGKAPPNDWAELVPIGPLGASRQVMQDAARALATSTGGGTALNDTALAAFRAVRGSYEAGKVNSVVLLTDGRNEDPDSIDTEALVRTLADESDPARPVPIIAIGMGPEVDFEALQRISGATGGKAYLTRDPADIRGVFLDALIQRQCRPDC